MYVYAIYGCYVPLHRVCQNKFPKKKFGNKFWKNKTPIPMCNKILYFMFRRLHEFLKAELKENQNCDV